jgi:hypothetical protein
MKCPPARLGTALVCALLFSSGAWWLAKACAPMFVVAVFSFEKHPDLPRSAFIKGRLGVMRPTFARSYWVIAYRYLTGVGLSAGEREQARAYYADRANGIDWRVQTDLSGTDWFARWRAVRARILNPAAPEISPVTEGQLAYNPQTHTFALNCASDAYRVALRTLEERRSRFGARSAAFRSWLSAQDAVFDNCDAPGSAMPAEASPALPPLIRQDRAYQIAAAYFIPISTTKQSMLSATSRRMTPPRGARSRNTW